jgi:hypothetical protein
VIEIWISIGYICKTAAVVFGNLLFVMKMQKIGERVAEKNEKSNNQAENNI